MPGLGNIGRGKIEVSNTRLQDVLKKHLDNFIDRVKDNLDKNEASGSLAASIAPKIEVVEDGLRITVEMEDYWEFIDKGRQGHGKRPPYSPGVVSILDFQVKNTYPDILKWIAQKPLQLRPPKRKKLKGNWKKQAAKTAAWFIAKKKARDYTPGNKFLSKEVDGFIEDLQKDIEKMYAKRIEITLT